MTIYAADTSVPVEKSRAEIEKLVTKFGADRFQSGWEPGLAIIMFEYRKRMLRFELMLPDPQDKRFTEWKNGQYLREPNEARKLHEQACRSVWRALALSIKAKLVAVDQGISEFDSEFLANIVVSRGDGASMTVGQMVLPIIQNAAKEGRQPTLALPPPLD